MTEPSPSPIPTTPSGQSWLDWLGPLNHLWKEQPFVAFILGLVITAALSRLGWVSRQVWKRWKRRHNEQRIARRKMQLPPSILPFSMGSKKKPLTFEPIQPQQENTPEELSIVRLLSAKSTPVPFLDRAKVLTRLETWARSEERFAIYVLGGDGGSGKTRLGVELCRRLNAPGPHRRVTEEWKTGFLQDIEESESTPPGNSLSLLLVMDYAEAQPETAKRIINTAYRAAKNPERQRVRIVFLVRRPSPLPITQQSSNEWVDSLRPQSIPKIGERDDINEGINRRLDAASTIVLNEEELSNSDRKDLFEAAYKSFSEPPDSPPSSKLLEELNDPMYSQPLLVIIYAFLNARPLPNAQRGCSPDDLFEAVLLHEQNYWSYHWPPSLACNTTQDRQKEDPATSTDIQDEADDQDDPNRKLARQAVAAATLADIQDEEDAISLLNLLPARPDKNIRDLAKWLRDCYPPHMNGDGHAVLWCAHLTPDRIGEHLVVSESENLTPLLRELLSPSRVGTSSLRTWTVLERASANPKLNEHVGRILNDVLTEVTQAIQTQAVDSQNPDLAVGFAKLFSTVFPHTEPHKAHTAEQSLSSGYLTDSLACELALHAASITAPQNDSTESEKSTYASRHLSLSIRLANTGRRDEALKAARKSTKLYQQLHKNNPATFTPTFAKSLNNLANRLGEVGQYGRAMTASRYAVNLYRGLPEQDAITYKPALARSLISLTKHLVETNRRDEALEAGQDAVDLYRDLAEQHPTVYKPDLAMALSNLARHLSGSGTQDEVLGAYLESVNIFRNLANDDTQLFGRKFAHSLETYGQILEYYGKMEEAARIRQEHDEVLKRMKEMEEHDA